MDNEQITVDEQNGSSEIIDTPVESDDITTEVVETPDTDAEETEIETEIEEAQTPEKIKLGEKEYTQEELTELADKAEAQKAEQEANQYQPRELSVIEQDLARVQQDCQSDLVSMQKKYLAKGQIPIVEVFNPATQEMEQQHANYTPEQAFSFGVESNDWSYFINCLNPIDVASFLQEKGQFEKVYGDRFEYLNQEKGYIQHTEAKKADIGKWENFIATEAKENPAESYLLNELKNDYSFDEGDVKKFLDIYRKAKALEQNNVVLSAENNSAKEAMMNSSISGVTKPQGSTPTFTPEQIGKMKPAEFAKNEKYIDAQYGLSK
jgi:hypothetical protein